MVNAFRLQRWALFSGKSFSRHSSILKANRRGCSFLMPVQNVYSVQGKGTTVRGTIERGVVKTGDTVDTVGILETSDTVVKEIWLPRTQVDEGRAGEEVDLVIFGNWNDVKTGQVLCTPGSISAYSNFDANANVDCDITSGDTLQFNFRTIDVTGTVDLPEVDTLQAGGSGTISVSLESSIAMEEGTAFEIRDGTAVGSGVVTGF